MSNVLISKTKEDYLDNIEPGLIVAFKDRIKKRTLSGKVLAIVDDASSYVIETKNGLMYLTQREDIIWVKTGKRWPKGVYRALKGEKYSGK